MSTPSEIMPLVGDLLETVERLRSLEPVTTDRESGGLRETILSYLKGKILPELTAANDLPLFVGVQGGTNVGKSTVFNALAGKLLSPSIVQASATKHPLVFVHERWREQLLAEDFLPGFSTRELDDPKELIVDPEHTELMYFRFHSDDGLASIALIDSPDFDSALLSNAQVARQITVLSDLTVFVTTAQKYKDGDLVERLCLLKELKASVILVFNMVEAEIVFETLVEDLRSTASLDGGDFLAIRVPPSSAQHPEDEVRELLQRKILDPLRRYEVQEIKPLIVRRTCRRLLGHVRELCQRLAGQMRLKERLLDHLASELEEAVAAYARSFSLALPEETLAVRKLIRQTELWPLLELPRDLQKAGRALGVLSVAFSRFNDTARRLLMRLSRSDEGAIEDSPSAVAEYAHARNEADFENVLRAAEYLSRSMETFLRTREDTSPLAREILRVFFPPQKAASFAPLVREQFDVEVASRRGGEDLLRRIDDWIEKHPRQRLLVTSLTNSFKVTAGILLAWVLPPGGALHIANWFYFVLGYFLAAYAIALVLSLSMRRKRRFRKSRIEGMRLVLERSLVAPFKSALEETLRQQDVVTLEEAARSLERAVEADDTVPVER